MARSIDGELDAQVRLLRVKARSWSFSRSGGQGQGLKVISKGQGVKVMCKDATFPTFVGFPTFQ